MNSRFLKITLALNALSLLSLLLSVVVLSVYCFPSFWLMWVSSAGATEFSDVSLLALRIRDYSIWLGILMVVVFAVIAWRKKGDELYAYSVVTLAIAILMVAVFVTMLSFVFVDFAIGIVPSKTPPKPGLIAPQS